MQSYHTQAVGFPQERFPEAVGLSFTLTFVPSTGFEVIWLVYTAVSAQSSTKRRPIKG